jgi:short-subunit dehydrogenase
VQSVQPIDLLVNNAAMAKVQRFMETDAETFDMCVCVRMYSTAVFNMAVNAESSYSGTVVVLVLACF